MKINYFTTLKDCSCPDWKYRRQQDGSACKHMSRLRDAYALIAAQRDFNMDPGKDFNLEQDIADLF